MEEMERRKLVVGSFLLSEKKKDRSLLGEMCLAVAKTKQRERATRPAPLVLFGPRHVITFLDRIFSETNQAQTTAIVTRLKRIPFVWWK